MRGIADGWLRWPALSLRAGIASQAVAQRSVRDVESLVTMVRSERVVLPAVPVRGRHWSSAADGGDGSTMDKPSLGSGEPGDDLSFGRRLRRARMARKWGQLGLAERMFKVGLEFGGSATVSALKYMISKWECGRKSVGQDNLHLLAETLGIPVEDLGVWVDPDFVWERRTDGIPAPEPGGDPAVEGGRAEEDPDAGRG